MKNPDYLGDGVYVHQREGGDLVLTTGNHMPLLADNTIVLEDAVMVAFLNYCGKNGLITTSLGKSLI